MMHVNDPLEQEVMSLFENGSLHVNDMREFFAENVCEILDDDEDPMAHNEAALRIFDRWYRNLRKTLWTNGMKYALVCNGLSPMDAEKEANDTYRNAYYNINRKRCKGAYYED